MHFLHTGLMLEHKPGRTGLKSADLRQGCGVRGQWWAGHILGREPCGRWPHGQMVLRVVQNLLSVWFHFLYRVW